MEVVSNGGKEIVSGKGWVKTKGDDVVEGDVESDEDFKKKWSS